MSDTRDRYKDIQPLTEAFDENDFPENKFMQLIRILFTRYGSVYGFKFDTSDREISGFDGIVYENYPEIECPVIFHIIWAKGAINREPTASEIKEAFNQAVTFPGTFKSYILVTPRDLSEVETIWLNGFQREQGINTYHMGHKKIQEFMEFCPALQKYYYGPGWEEVEHFSVTDVRYKHSVIKSLKYLEFIGLPTWQYKRQNFLKSTELKQVYIPPYFTKDQRIMVFLSLTDLIKASNRNVILGDAGTGKSTLAKYLALVYAAENKGNDEFKIENKTPFIITIRDYVWIKQKNSDSFGFVDYLEYTAENNYNLKEIDKDYFIASLELGKAVVLFDGLDEVNSKPVQAEIVKEIKKFAHFYPESAVWITSRILGYGEDALFDQGQFVHYYIAPVTMDQACEFVERWYQVQMPEKKDERENRINSLKKAIKENVGVRRLQTNPLLLTMMAFVHQFEGTLPDDRGRLYEKCIELLLKSWQDQKYISQGEENPLAKIGLRYDDQLRLLAAAAFHIQEKNQAASNDFGRGVIGEKELETKLFEILYDPRRITKDKARKNIKTFLFYIRDRVGLFVDAGKSEDGGENIFSFFHLSFLEYLCAYQITQDISKSQQEHIDTLMGYMGKPSWEEIVLLALYILSKSPNGNAFLDSFMNRVFERLKIKPAPYIWYLVGRAVRDNINLTFEDIYRIIKGLLELWLIDNTDQVAPKIIHEIVDFSPDGREFLEKILKENIRNNSAPQAFASLNFFSHYFVVNDEIIDAVTNNRDSRNLLPYLPVFRGNRMLSRFARENLEESQWTVYYNSVTDHTGENLDGLINYSVNDRELKGYIISSWSKVFNTIRGRKQFLDKNRPAENSGLHPGNIDFDFEYAFIKYPLHLFRLFIEPTAVPPDFPGDIHIYRIPDGIFNRLGKAINPGLNQAYVAAWINWILEKGLSDLAKSAATQYELAPAELNQLKEVRQRYSSEFGRYLSDDLSKYLSEGFIEDIMNLLNDTQQQDFSRHSTQDFNIYLSQDFKRNNTQYFSKGFSRFIEREFGLELNHKFIRYFFKYFTPDICRVYVRNCWQKFSPEFRGMISDKYSEFYSKKLNWANFDNFDQNKLHNCFLDHFMENNETFIDYFYSYLYDYLFFRKVKIQFSEQLTPGAPPLPGKEIQTDCIRLKINEQLMFPFTFDFILTAAFNHYIINILADLNNKFYKKVKPTQPMIREAVEDYCRNHSFLSYIIKEAWSIYAKEFKEKSQPGHPENNLRLACFLTNAAKVSMVTDMPCTGSEWDKLLIEAEGSNDPFVKVALSLYKISIFEDPRANTAELYERVRDFQDKYPQYYKLIGFSS